MSPRKDRSSREPWAWLVPTAAIIAGVALVVVVIMTIANGTFL